MKKIFPVLTFVMIFFAFLAMQIAQDISTSHANKATSKQDQKTFYEDLYKKSSVSLRDKTIRLSKIKEPIVVITFWASWCVPCLQEFPSLVKLNKFYKDKIFTIGINTDDESPTKKIEKIQKKYNLNFESISDAHGKFVKDFMVDNIPFTLTFVKGRLIHVSEETHDFLDQKYLDKIKEAL